ncbi:MAG: hypothetical protein ABI871_06740 [Chthoniobacterales bacterium]
MEIAIAVFILLLLVMLAVPSLNGVLKDRRLRHSLDSLNGLVRQAQERSVAERRSYLIIWNKDALALRTETYSKGEKAGPVATLRVSPGDSFSLKLPAALIKDAPAEWIFWPSGTCEPATIGFKGNDGHWTATYSPLTARPTLSNYATK